MPIFEFTCKSCGRQFETLVRPGTPPPACPVCASTELERLTSLPAVHSSGTHALALKAAAKRDKVRGSEMARAQREYELHHND
ncbi:MAG: zinc ribbon domain-containing protein [Acidobacteriota bacterium]|nr:zinc ribbon domain-containing protein [Acidobacteriota bacterium]